jgi:hypothetical protein
MVLPDQKLFVLPFRPPGETAERKQKRKKYRQVQLCLR